MLLFGFAMVLIMVWRPRGLIATREPSTLLHARHAPRLREPQGKGPQPSLVRERQG
jgi:branched-chain amino acid transport system permease protein